MWAVGLGIGAVIVAMVAWALDRLGDPAADARRERDEFGPRDLGEDSD